MILADKIILLRRRKGWSQEELAEQLGVTRQSISKWEGAQSAPELDKIIKMSEVFGVSCDLLLKDELEPSDSPIVEKPATLSEEPTAERTAIAKMPVENSPSHEESEEESGETEEESNAKSSLIEHILYPVIGLAIAAYFFLGFTMSAWGWAWILPVAPFIVLIILNSLTDKSGERTVLENLGDAVSYTALLIFLLIGLIHGGWAWAWIFPAVSFISFGILNTLTDKTNGDGLVGKVSGVLFGVALLTFLLIGFFHGGWAWAWIIPAGAFVALAVFRLVLDSKNAKNGEEERHSKKCGLCRIFAMSFY
jgi:transcriptional regulator with XRE-family HTH domain